jgi:hypothetical protein
VTLCDLHTALSLVTSASLSDLIKRFIKQLTVSTGA